MNIQLNIDPQNPNVTAHALNEHLKSAKTFFDSNLHRTGIHPPRRQPEAGQPEKHHQKMGKFQISNPSSWMDSFHIGDPSSWNDLTVYPIFRSPYAYEDELELVDLERAIEGGLFKIVEVSEMGVVSALRAANQSSQRVIIFDGEELIGAKQDRVANATIIVGAHQNEVIPVSCVEKGRWRRQSRHFSAGEFLHPSLRRKKFRNVTANLRSGRGYQTDQRMIWDQIASKSARMEVESKTGAIRDVEDRYFVYNAVLQQSIPHFPDQLGYLTYVRGGFAGGDIFPSTSISWKKYTKLLRSYLLDAQDPDVEFPKMKIGEIRQEIASSRIETVKALGAGLEHRFKSLKIQGSYTLLDDRLAHMTIFPKVRSKAHVLPGNFVMRTTGPVPSEVLEKQGELSQMFRKLKTLLKTVRRKHGAQSRV